MTTGLEAGTAAAVMRGGRVVVQQIAVDAFGNALGSSLASASSGAPVTSSDPLGEFIDKNMPVWEQRQANFDQVVGAFSTPGQINLGEGDLVAAGDGFTMGKMVSVIERGRTTFIDADDLSGLSDTELMSRAKALVGGSGSGGRGIGGSRELNASVLYQQGLGDIREYTSPLTAGAANGGDDLWFPHDGGGTLAGQRMTPAEAAAFDAANGLSPPFNFQKVNDQKVTAGAYDRFGELDRAWSAGNWSDMWRHIAFQASPQARDVAIQRSFPAPHPDMARIQRMANSPIGTIASSIGRVFGADQQRQDALLMTGSLLEQLSGTGSQVYKQTLTAPPPMPGTYARVRGVGKQARALPGITPETKRGVVQFQGVEVRAVRDLGHVDTSTLQAMQKYGFAAKDGAGSSLVMHHHRQNPAGPIIEMPAGNHSIGKATQHPFGNTKGSGLTPQQRAEFDQWRVDYWKWRATQELQNRGLQ